MKPRARKLLAFLGIAAGVVLVSVELASFEDGAAWWWLLVGILLILLGLAELLLPSPPDRLG
jgi:uncharacterized membrane protein HdeD (DUF308 family)